jgi:hypothetical protein
MQLGSVHVDEQSAEPPHWTRHPDVQPVSLHDGPEHCRTQFPPGQSSVMLPEPWALQPP